MPTSNHFIEYTLQAYSSDFWFRLTLIILLLCLIVEISKDKQNEQEGTRRNRKDQEGLKTLELTP